MDDAHPSLRWTCVSFLSVLALLPASIGWGQEPPVFPERRPQVLELPRFENRDISALTATLDQLIAAPAHPSDTRTALWNFGRQLQGGTLTPAQEARVVGHLSAIARARPGDAAGIEGAMKMVTALTPGKVAPDIVGRDLQGAPLRLRDYRGKVVVLVFSAEWCGICQSLVPYERLMLDLYKNWPFAILGIETGSSRDVMLKAKTEQGLTYRSWWDGTDEEGPGPIATAWNAGGFPAVYVLDGKGVIRFVDTRHEDLLKAVRQLLTEHVAQSELASRGGAKPGL
jgi:peroxiredoxin